jgi:hypothetical protein
MELSGRIRPDGLRRILHVQEINSC